MSFATCTIRLTAEEIDQIEEWLLMDNPVPDAGPELFERIMVVDGLSFALRVINGTHHPFLDATLAIGDELLLCDAGDDPSPLGDYVFEHGDEELSLYVVEGHRVEQKDGDLWLKQESGRTIVCESGDDHAWGSMVRVLDPYDFEIVCWEASEWSEAPESVMGAIMACVAGKGAS